MARSRSSTTWAAEAAEERAFYDSLPVEALHTQLHERQFGRYYTIWYSIAQRSTLPVSAWALLDVLERRSVDGMARQHAASALIQMMDTQHWQAVDLVDDEAVDLDARLRAFKNDVLAQIARESRG
jgi:hypothetical protein